MKSYNSTKDFMKVILKKSWLFLGNYIDGKKQGKGISLDDDGSFIVSEFKDDKVISSYKIDDLLNNLPNE